MKSSKVYNDMKICFSELLEREDKAAVNVAYLQVRAVAASTPAAAPGASLTLMQSFADALGGLMGQERCALLPRRRAGRGPRFAPASAAHPIVRHIAPPALAGESSSF